MDTPLFTCLSSYTYPEDTDYLQSGLDVRFTLAMMFSNIILMSDQRHVFVNQFTTYLQLVYKFGYLSKYCSDCNFNLESESLVVYNCINNTILRSCEMCLKLNHFYIIIKT